MRKIEPEFITGMGYIGASSGVLYHMGGAGEQTVVTGNPALLENVKGNRFTSLTLHGISSQGSTTGAQLFNVSEILAETWLSTETPVEEHAVGYWTSGYIPVKTGNYICSSKGSARGWTYDADKNGLRYIANSGGSPIPIKEGEAFIRVTGANTADPQNFMFNEGNSIKPYEPYTGGKPSPSPQYPQEIKSAGQGKTIGVEVLGKNLLNPLRFFSGRTHNGITWTVKNNGEIVCEGTALGDSFMGAAILYPDVRWLKIPAGRYVLSGSGEHVMVYINTVSLNGDKENAYYCQYNSSIKCVFTEDVYITLQATVRSGETVAETVCPQLESGDTATSYEPYKPAQTLIIPTPNGLPGIPVSSGGNYTDADGQRWMCDEVDFKKGVYVQRVATETPKAQWSSFVETADVPNRYRITGALINKYRSCSDKCLISHGIYTDWGASPGWTLNSGAFYYHPEEDVTKEEAKEQILGFINSANPLTFLGQLETPIEIPLTTEQLAAYKALRTYSPTTTVANDAGAGMSVGYRRK